MLPSLWNTLVRSGKRQARARRRAADLSRRRPSLEALEDRTLLAASLSMPTDVAGPYGTDVTVPVTINQLDDGHGATGLSQVDLDIAYDKTAFTVSPTTGVTLGSLLPSGQWDLSYGIVSSSTFSGQDELQIIVRAEQNLTTTAGGTLVNITFHVNSPGAPAGLYPLNVANNPSTGNVTDAYSASGQQYVFNPAPTNSPNDANVDGSINVGASNPQVVFVLSGPTPVTAGNSFNFTITAEYSNGNPDPLYNGTAHFTSTDPKAVLPADTTFVAGTSTLTLPATLKTAGTQTLTATDTADSSITGTSNQVKVNPAAASQIVITQQPSPTATAGVAFAAQPVVKLEDAFGNVVTGDSTDTVTATSTGSAALQGTTTLTLSSGVAAFSGLSYDKAETIQLGFTTTAGSFTATSNDVVVSPNVATHFAVAAPSSAAAGAPFDFTVTALDAYENTATGYAGTVHFSTVDNRGTLPGDSALSNGVGTFSATFTLATTEKITAADKADGSIKGTSDSIVVNPGPLSKFGVAGPANPTAGVSNTYTYLVTAEDQYGNRVPTYAGTVHLTSSDPLATLQGDYTFVPADSGSHNLGVIFRTVGGQSVTATDTSDSTITGTDTSITVNPATILISVPSTATAGSAFSYTVTVKDFFGNTATGYAGTLHFTSTDPLASAGSGLPADYTFTTGSGGDDGLHTFSATLETPGGQTVTATDTDTPQSTGTSNAIQVYAAAQFLKTDSATQGYWQGAYGGDGYNVIDGGVPNYPAYATVTEAGAADYVWAASTPDLRGLQKPANPADRVAAASYAAGGFTVNLDLSGGTHRVALYLLDFDGGGRSERIDVLDAVSGKVLDSETASNFGGGEYLAWTLGGSVALRFTQLSGPNAVLSGLFFGPAGAAPSGSGSAAFVKADAGTQGTWKGAYGGDGYNVVAAGAPSYPAYAAVTPVGPADYVWEASTPDTRGLQKPAPADPSDRVAAAWYAASTFTVNLDLTGGTHQVALYLLDWDGGGRSEQIDVLDAVTGKVLDSQTASGFRGGEYLVWDVGGYVTFRLTRQSGPNAVLSGLFFDPTA